MRDARALHQDSLHPLGLRSIRGPVCLKISGGSNHSAPFSLVLLDSGVLEANGVPHLDPCILNAKFGSLPHLSLNAGAALKVSPVCLFVCLFVFFFFFSGRQMESQKT